MGRRLFVIRDMTIRGIEEMLEDLCDPDEPYPGLDEAFTHGIDEANRIQGSIGSDVYTRIEHATHILALMDEPNANVGFEVGYALALGKPVALARVRSDLPEWATRNPFPDFHLPRARDVDDLLELARGDSWIRLGRASTGSGTVVLCPDEGIGKSVRRWIARLRQSWRLVVPPPLLQIPELLRGVGRVVWVIIPSTEPRDGPENASHSVLAGFARGLGLELKVLMHRDHDRIHPIQDVRSTQQLWAGREELEAALPPAGDVGRPTSVEVSPSRGGQASTGPHTATESAWPVTTIEQSRESRPSWAADWGDAPQATIEGRTWSTVTGTHDYAAGLVICKIESTALRQRFFLGPTRPSLQATLSWNGRSVIQNGPDRSATMYVTAPLANFRAGDRISLEVRDRRTFSIAVLCTILTEFRDFPFELSAETLSVSFSYVARQEVEKALTPTLHAAKESLERLRTEVRRDDLDNSLSNLTNAQRTELAKAAALVGWADPRVLPLVAEYERKYRVLAENMGEVSLRAAKTSLERLRTAVRLDDVDNSLSNFTDEQKGLLAKAAALVGSADPRVSALAAEYERKCRTLADIIGEQVRRTTEDLPDGWTPIGDHEWSTARLIHKSGDPSSHDKNWLVRVPIRTTKGVSKDWMARSQLLRQLELVDANGVGWPLRERDLSEDTDPEVPIALVPSTDTDAYPTLPALIRARTKGRVLFKRIE